MARAKPTPGPEVERPDDLAIQRRQEEHVTIRPLATEQEVPLLILGHVELPGAEREEVRLPRDPLGVVDQSRGVIGLRFPNRANLAGPDLQMLW